MNRRSVFKSVTKHKSKNKHSSHKIEAIKRRVHSTHDLIVGLIVMNAKNVIKKLEDIENNNNDNKVVRIGSTLNLNALLDSE